MHDMREICANCGATYGEHRSVDAACPDDMEGGYFDNLSFKPFANRYDKRFEAPNVSK